ncbi:MAG: methylmalonyl-CoA mutase family protein, partial [Gammaproteobacteria bacterium]|nr:methylmalonyl-CoA mutase family protein [Gammaproteobacteria bacterium]
MSSAAREIKQDARQRRSPLRFVTAASLFDGHDAAINIIRRLIQAQGAEVIHLGHNRSVADIVNAAIQEDADAIACSSYQGGHNEYFRYMVDMLRERDAEHVRVVVGGGGTIAPDEIEMLESYGVEKIYRPEDGLRLGLTGMIKDVFSRVHAWPRPGVAPGSAAAGTDHQAIATMLTALEESRESEQIAGWRELWSDVAETAPVIGITGTGGAGKSSLTDELLSRFLRQFPDLHVAVVAMDPTRRRSGGALLGDRIRMNSLANERIYMRSLATRRAHLATSAVLTDIVSFLRQSGFGLVVVETAGIGQSDSEIVDIVDLSVYVMTSDYGAASQLEKIEMLDFADLVALNKFEKRGAQDALRDIRKQWKRNHTAFDTLDDEIPVFPTIASQFNDAGVNHLFNAVCQSLDSIDSKDWTNAIQDTRAVSPKQAIIPPQRIRYLAEIVSSARDLDIEITTRANAASLAQACYRALQVLDDEALPAVFDSYPESALAGRDSSVTTLRRSYNEALATVGVEAQSLLREWPERVQGFQNQQYAYTVRGREISGDNYTETLSGSQIPKIAVPQLNDWGDLLRFLMKENLPGGYPYTAGVYPYRREQEDPTRQFAGEGTPERTNRRFHYLSAGHASTRLSTAFDSATLYGEDPDARPDIYGRIGNSGVSIATLDDMKKLYSGFDLCRQSTSVSMTINGPAPMLLAMFLNTAIDQQVERYLREQGLWGQTEKKIEALYRDRKRPVYSGSLPDGHDGFGLGLLGVSGDQVLDAEAYERICAETLRTVRGTVQADILKEDQAQNTCI